MDEKISRDVSTPHIKMSNSSMEPYARDTQMIPDSIINELRGNKEYTPMKDKIQKSREEIYSESHFEWVKTERQGEVSKFANFLFENDAEYVVFQDNSRIRTDLVGDVVLMHQYPEEILGFTSAPIQPDNNTILNHMKAEHRPLDPVNTTPVIHVIKELDPVKEIFDKSKKKTEKVTLTISLKILPPDLYHVIKDNFDDVDDVLLQTAMDQIHDSLLREALKKELQSIYQKRRKIQ